MDEGSNDHSDLDDGREVYDWTSCYPAGAWFQIVPEFLLLTAYLVLPGYFLLELIIEPPD